MAGFTMGTVVFESIDKGFAAIFTNGLAAFSAYIAPIIGVFVSLYFVMTALSWIWNGQTSDFPVGQLMKKFFYLALFTSFAFNASHYKTVVVDPVNKIGGEISATFAKNGTQAPQVIDQMVNQISDTITLIWDKMKPLSIMKMNLGPFFRAIGAIIIVGVFGTVFAVIASLYLLVAKVLVSMVLLVGPLYIAFAFFPVTREFFMKWISALLNYILLYAMFGIAFTLLTNILQSYVTGTGFDSTLVGDLTQIKLLFCYLLFSGVIIAIPSMTSQLTGGVGINSLGAIGPLANAATGGLTKALTKLTQATKSAGRGNNIAGGGRNRKLG